jgi:outer membrane protein
MNTKTTLAPTLLCLAVISTMLYASSAVAEDKDAFVSEWHGLIGLGVLTRPKYPGAKDTKSELFPAGRITYDRYFIGGGVGPGIGAYLYKDPNFEFGLGLSHQISSPRSESDDPHLHGLGDVPSTTRAVVFGAYHYEWLKFGVRLFDDVGGKHQGLQALFEAEASWRPTRRLELTAGPRIIYGDSKYMQTLFGVTPAQSLASGLPVYMPKSGFSQASLLLGSDYLLTKSWIVGARASFGQLEGDAGKSPITQKKAQNEAGIYFGYKF